MTWHLKGQPHKVQIEAFKRAARRNGFAYFMEMGLGKTATTLNEMVEAGAEHDAYVVLCPNSMKQVWAEEAETWGLPYKVMVWPKVATCMAANQGNTLLIMNWEALLGKGGQYLHRYMRDRSIYLAGDESIFIKNPRAKRTKVFLSLVEMVKTVRLLSGKPIVNSPLDIWAQLRAIGAPVSRNPYAFRNHFCVMGGWQGKQIVGAQNQEELARVIAGHSFQATKAEWTDLPEKIYTRREYEMTKDQARYYKTMMDDFMVELESGAVTAPMVVTQLNKLQQIASGFIYKEDGRGTPILGKAEPPKIALVKEILEEVNGKVIIFVKYRFSGEMLAEAFEQEGVVTLRGGQSREEQKAAMDAFNKDDGVRVCVAAVSSAKYGLTLLGSGGQPCHTTIYYENDFSLDTRAQSEDRNHRHGQRNAVTYIDLVGSPVERKVIKALQKKENLVKSLMGRKAAA